VKKLSTWMLAAAALTAFTIPAQAAKSNIFEPQMKQYFESSIKVWLSDPAVIKAVKAQNKMHAAMSAADVEAADQKWRAEKKAGGGAMIKDVLGNDLSQYLKAKRDGSGGVAFEMFVMDNKGMNVGQSDGTSDYMQGDEAKWQKTYSVGPNAVYVDEVEYDADSKTYQSQMSATISDGGKAIGAITIGINVQKLK
jgi:hypothetical protein